MKIKHRKHEGVKKHLENTMYKNDFGKYFYIRYLEIDRCDIERMYGRYYFKYMYKKF